MSDEPMEFGYPAEADIVTILAAIGIEHVKENNSNFLEAYRQEMWGLINAVRWAATLGVWLPSSTTFNVRGGKYNWRGDVKTYTAGGAVDPTDNDTTYIWMKSDNTIASGIDGDGWPSYDHIKLAEIGVDSGGDITDVTDLRGESLLRHASHNISASVAAVDLNSVAFTNLLTVPSGKKLIVTHVALRNLSADAASAIATLGQSGDKDDFLTAQTLSNLNAASKAAILQPIPNATPVAIVEYTAGEIFGIDVTQAAGSACTCTADVHGTLIDA